MKILSYGEDALTLWAIKNKLDQILQTLQDPSDPSTCKIFFRPSFGRSGGEGSSQFGEFDFIILSEDCLYLGESKWDRSSEKIEGGILQLREEQLLRHRLFQFYVENWAFDSYSSWSEFTQKRKSVLKGLGIRKPLASEKSRLAANLQTVLSIIKKHFSSSPDIRNILLFLHDGRTAEQLPRQAPRDFHLVPVDYSGHTIGNFVKIDI
jgi:hypothetical protein